MLIILIVLFLFPFCFFPFPPKPHRHADCLLVLGCPTQTDGTCSKALKRRLDKAIELYNQGYASSIIVSGGSPHNQFIEALAMEKYLKQQIDAKIYTEKEARNTFENFLYSKKICDAQHFTKIIVVTGTSHVLRSSFFAKKFFSDYSFIDDHEPFSIKKYLSEYLALYNTLYCEVKFKLKK